MTYFILFYHLLVAMVGSTPAEDKPHITFEQSTIKLGEVYPGQRYDRVFTFTNTGSAPLIITDVEKSCGCTVASYTEQPVMPGAKGEIKVNYTPKPDLGFSSKSFIVKSNADNGQEYIYLHATVVKKNK